MAQSLHVLIVEPDAEVERVIRLMLEGAGYAVSGARDAEGARAVLNQHPDIIAIVLDATLRGETAASLSEYIEARGLSMVMMSGRPSAMEKAETESNQLLSKPFRQTELLDALQAAIDSGVAGQRGT